MVLVTWQSLGNVYATLLVNARDTGLCTFQFCTIQRFQWIKFVAPFCVKFHKRLMNPFRMHRIFVFVSMVGIS